MGLGLKIQGLGFCWGVMDKKMKTVYYLDISGLKGLGFGLVCSICVCREVCRAVAKALLPLWLPFGCRGGIWSIDYVLHIGAVGCAKVNKSLDP